MRIIIISALALLPPLAAQARVLRAGAGQAYATPSSAVSAAMPGDVVLISPGTYYDCFSIARDRVTVRGDGGPQSVVLTDKACQGKALVIVDGSGDVVSGLTLARARVPDGNGAGIRAEGGDLSVDHVVFSDDQDGLITSDSPSMRVTVTDSSFLKDGHCGEYCAHGIYAGRIASLTVLRATMSGTREGHAVKSRAAATEVRDSRIEDGPDGTSSYLVEIPNGGSLVLSGCVLEKGPGSQNHAAAVAIGLEGVEHPTPFITVSGNRFANDGSYRTTFVRNVTATGAVLEGNVIAGRVDPLSGDGVVR